MKARGAVPVMSGIKPTELLRFAVDVVYSTCTYKPAHIHLWDFGGDWGVYWGTCKAGPNTETQRWAQLRKGGKLLPMVRREAPNWW